jgi:hypothetical protein
MRRFAYSRLNLYVSFLFLLQEAGAYLLALFCSVRFCSVHAALVVTVICIERCLL